MDLISQQDFVTQPQKPQIIMFKRHHCHHRLIQRADANFSQQRLLVTVGKPGRTSLTERLFIRFF
ncbi:TPA: hypothetical protein HI078_003927 [Escherichia coli]|nr:hypothetical protein [Escherichia coli]